MTGATRPFNRDYVLEVTLAHALKAVDSSVLKTTARIPEFRDNAEKSQEILQTLDDLHKLKAAMHQSTNRKSQ